MNVSIHSGSEGVRWNPICNEIADADAIVNPVDWELQSMDLLGSDSRLRRHVTNCGTCGQHRKALLCLNNYMPQSRYGRGDQMETHPIEKKKRTLKFNLWKQLYEWNYCLNKLLQKFRKLRTGGVMHEGLHKSRKRNLETKREIQYPSMTKDGIPPREARQSG